MFLGCSSGHTASVYCQLTFISHDKISPSLVEAQIFTSCNVSLFVGFPSTADRSWLVFVSDDNHYPTRQLMMLIAIILPLTCVL